MVTQIICWSGAYLFVGLVLVGALVMANEKGRPGSLSCLFLVLTWPIGAALIIGMMLVPKRRD